MEGYRREKSSQAILATNLEALQQHRRNLQEKKEMEKAQIHFRERLRLALGYSINTMDKIFINLA